MLELNIIHGSSPDNPTLKKKFFNDQGGVIGRDPNADWSLFDLSRVISSQHAKIIFSQGNYYLSDLSANGIETEQGQKLRKGEYRLLKMAEVYVIGPYHIEVTQVNAKDATQAFKEAGLDHILGESNPDKEELSPLHYAQQQHDFLNATEAFNDFPVTEKPNTLKAFDFMPEPFEFMTKPIATTDSWLSEFCRLFNLDTAAFAGVSDIEAQKTIECLFTAMAKKLAK